MPARRRFAWLLLTALAASCGPPEPPPAEQWLEVGGAEEGFTVRLPGAPAEKAQQVLSPFGPLPSHSWIHQDGRRAFSIAWTDYPADVKSRMSDAQLLDAARDAAVRKSAGRLAAEEPAELGGHPGRRLRIDAAGGTALVQGRLYVVGLRLYQVMATTLPDVGDAPAVATFLDSFALQPGAPAVSSAPPPR